MVETDLKLIDFYDPIIKDLDRTILKLAKGHDPTSPRVIGGGGGPWIFSIAGRAVYRPLVVELLYVFGAAHDAANYR